MNIYFPQYDFELDLKEDDIIVTALEAPTIFRAVIEDIFEQNSGQTGQIILSDCGEILNLEKTASVLLNPYLANCNDKKIVSKLYKEILAYAMDFFFDDVQAVNGKIIELLDKLSQSIPYGVSFNLSLDMASLLKIYAVSVSEEDSSLLDKMINFFKVMHRIGGYQLFIAFNFRQYFSEEELKKFYEFVVQEHLILLIIEGDCLGRKCSEEKLWILDSDLCIIETN